MGEIDIAAELFHAVSMAVFCSGLLFCLACVIDARRSGLMANMNSRNRNNHNSSRSETSYCGRARI